LSSFRYFLEIETHLSDTHTTDTPIELSVKYTSFDGVSLYNLTMYHTIVDILLYPPITHLDISYVVHVVS